MSNNNGLALKILVPIIVIVVAALIASMAAGPAQGQVDRIAIQQDKHAERINELEKSGAAASESFKNILIRLDRIETKLDNLREDRK